MTGEKKAKTLVIISKKPDMSTMANLSSMLEAVAVTKLY